MTTGKTTTLFKHKYFEFALKTFISFYALWYILHSKFIHFSFDFNFSFIILSLIIFSLLNWFFEIKKWQFLVENIQKIDFYTAFKQSLISFSISLLTPNRVGEYGAKILFFEKPKRKRIFHLNLIGNLSQLILTLFFGLIGLFYYLFTQSIEYQLYKTNFYYLLIGVFLILTMIFFGYKYRKIIYKKFIIDRNIWQETIKYSLLRYLSFATQFYLFWIYFNPQNTGFKVVIAIFLTYFIASIIPVLAFMDWAVKGTASVFAFHLLGFSTQTLLNIIALMWTYNFLLPFFIGLVLMWTSKYKVK